MNCLIVDDDALARSILTKLARDSGVLEVIDAVETPEEAIRILNTEEIELLFLDIELNEMTGFELLSTLSDPPMVIVVSASAQNAAKAFDYNVIDFILKPISKPRFLKALSKVQTFKKRAVPPRSQNEQSLFIKKNEGYIKVDIADIYYLEADSDYVHIITKGGRFMLTNSLTAMEHQLNTEHFVRVHRSYVVNVDHIKSFEENRIVTQKVCLGKK